MNYRSVVEDFESFENASAWMEAEVDDPCVDNYRFAWSDDDNAMARYEELKEDGCCGRFDRKITIQGREAMIGCNYGH